MFAAFGTRGGWPALAAIGTVGAVNGVADELLHPTLARLDLLGQVAERLRRRGE